MIQSKVDKVAAVKAVKDLLLALGQDVTSEGLKGTPERVARMYIEQCTAKGNGLDRLFEEKHDEMVMVKDIPVVSMCEHHLLPWFGKAHIAYLPGKKGLLGISKLARTVYSCSIGFTIQERVTSQVAEAIVGSIEPPGVMVVVEAEHTCMTLRGAKAVGAVTITSAVRGLFRDVPAARAEFLSLLNRRYQR